MEAIKAAFCVSLATGAAAAYLFARGKPWEEVFYRRTFAGGLLAKLAASLAIYVGAPHLVRGSDALLYYRQVQWYLAGETLYFDINTPYSLLFLPLLSIPLRIWDSVGAIVLTMLAIETAMLFAYLRHYGGKDSLAAWRVAFLYGFSPISFYWVALTGYNSVLIAAFTIFALVLADRGKDVLSGQAALLGFLVSKLLAVLSWPAIAFYDRSAWMARSVSMSLPLLPLALLPLFGVNPLRFLGDAFLTYSGGNVWSLVAQISPGFRDTLAWRAAPLIAFNLVFWPLFVSFCRNGTEGGNDRFDRVMAFAAATHLLFMMVSRKSYTFYLPMFFLLAVHGVVRSRTPFALGLLPVVFLGATTTLEVHLYQTTLRSTDVLLTSSPAAAVLFAVDLLTVGSYLCLFVLSGRAALAGRRGAARQSPRTDRLAHADISEASSSGTKK